MKRLFALALLLALFAGGRSALAVTSPETGEEIYFDGRYLYMYDLLVLESLPSGVPFHTVKTAATQPAGKVLPAVTKDIARLWREGDVLEAEFVRIDHLMGERAAEALEELTLEEQGAAIADAIGALQMFDRETRAFSDGGDAESLETPVRGKHVSWRTTHGYLERDGKRLPFVRVTLQVLYAQKGKYAKSSESARTFNEVYTFVYGLKNAKNPDWELYTIVRYLPDFFETKGDFR